MCLPCSQINVCPCAQFIARKVFGPLHARCFACIDRVECSLIGASEPQDQVDTVVLRAGHIAGHHYLTALQHGHVECRRLLVLVQVRSGKIPLIIGQWLSHLATVFSDGPDQSAAAGPADVSGRGIRWWWLGVQVMMMRRGRRNICLSRRKHKGKHR